MATHYFSLRGRVQILSHSCVEHAHTQARYLGTLFRMLLLLLVFPRLLCMVFLFFSCWSSCSRPMCHPAGPKAFNLVRATFLPLKPPRYWCLPVRDPGVNYSTLFTLHSGAFILWLLAVPPTAFPTTESKNGLFCEPVYCFTHKHQGSIRQQSHNRDLQKKNNFPSFCHTQATIHRQTPPK